MLEDVGTVVTTQVTAAIEGAGDPAAALSTGENSFTSFLDRLVGTTPGERPSVTIRPRNGQTGGHRGTRADIVPDLDDQWSY